MTRRDGPRAAGSGTAQAGDRHGSGAPVLVTGATGTVGRHVVAGLRERGVPVRVASRDPDRALADLDPSGTTDVEAVRFAFDDPDTHGPALAGVGAVFLVRPGPVSAGAMFPFLDRLAATGPRCVLLSVQGADRNPLLPHARLEARLRERAVPSTFLRAGFFMDNLHTFHRAEIWGSGEIWVPAGGAALAMVDARDVAAVGVAALCGEAGPDATTDGSVVAYEPTGAERVTFCEVARVMTAELDRDIEYVRPSLPRYAWHAWRRRGQAPGFVAVQGLLYTMARLGVATAPTDDVRRVTGREPRDLHDYVRYHRDAWL
jgi:uncharacterized protein YbjT (DUF2867 family)